MEWVQRIMEYNLLYKTNLEFLYNIYIPEIGVRKFPIVSPKLGLMVEGLNYFGQSEDNLFDISKMQCQTQNGNGVIRHDKRC